MQKAWRTVQVVLANLTIGEIMDELASDNVAGKRTFNLLEKENSIRPIHNQKITTRRESNDLMLALIRIEDLLKRDSETKDYQVWLSSNIMEPPSVRIRKRMSELMRRERQADISESSSETSSDAGESYEETESVVMSNNNNNREGVFEVEDTSEKTLELILLKKETKLIKIGYEENGEKPEILDNVSDLLEELNTPINLDYVDTFPEPSVRNWEQWKLNWSNLSISLVVKHVTELNFLSRFRVTDQRIDTGVQLYSRLEGLTPDFHYFEGGKLKVVEFKSYLYAPAGDKMMKVAREIEEKYSPAEVTVVFVTADETLPYVLGLGKKETDFFKRIRKMYREFGHKNKNFLKHESADWKEEYTPIDDLFEVFPFKPWTENILPKEVTNVKERTYEDLLDNIVENSETTFEFLKGQGIHIRDMPTLLPNDFTMNISPEHPFDRDANRRFSGGSYGHRSKFLLPYLCGFKNTDLNELLQADWVGDRNVKQILQMNSVAHAEMLEVRLLNRYVALIQTDHSKGIYSKISSVLGLGDSTLDNRKDMRAAIKKKAKEVKQRVIKKIGERGTEGRENWKFTERGTFRSSNAAFNKKHGIKTQKGEK
jgi:hypothetical protein